MEICQGTIAVIHPREGFDPALHREFHSVPGIHHVIVGLIMGLAKILDPFNPKGSIRDMPKHPGPRGLIYGIRSTSGHLQTPAAMGRLRPAGWGRTRPS